MIRKIKSGFLVLMFVFLAVSLKAQEENDHIFPAAAAAKPFIDFDSKGFLLKGKRTFIVSAGLEYARIPHELWYDRLLRIKRAGFNCIEIYTMWNFHEPHENQFLFTGDQDLGSFLKLVKSLDLYAIVRVGPYYCAEWDNGGYPIWLKFKDGVSVREPNAPFEHYVDRFFDRLLPVVFQNQINKGGAVILVQLENEHPKGWGTDMPNPYFKHLQAQALKWGIQVPYFFSGLHHDSDPAGEAKLDEAGRPNPWMSTEFWSVWFNQYGPRAGDELRYDRRTWKIIARGGNGYNYYMVHGGSNFGYANNDEDAASYDYGAAIGQAGDLRPIYYTFKRAALFSRSFEDVLENSIDNSGAYTGAVSDTATRVTARKSPAGELIFLDNRDSAGHAVHFKIPENKEEALITLSSRTIYPIVHQYKLSKGISLNWAFSRIFAQVKQANTTTLIVEAEAGEPVRLEFSFENSIKAADKAFEIKGKTIRFYQTMPQIEHPLIYQFSSAGQTIRLLLVDRKWSDQTWVLTEAGKNYIVSGASFISSFQAKGQIITAELEEASGQNQTNKIWLYSGQALKSASLSNPLKKTKNSTGKTADSLLTLKNWEMKSGFPQNGSKKNRGGWLSSSKPLPMGADGDISPDAWYHTDISVPESALYTLQVKGGGRGTLFLNRKAVSSWVLNTNEVKIPVEKGKQAIDIFTAHDGRDKLAAYLGPLKDVDSKGIFGAALLKKGGPFIHELQGWSFFAAEKAEDVKKGPPADTAAFKVYKIGADAFDHKQGFGWFQTRIPRQPDGIASLTLLFKSVDENATIFLDGKRLFHHEGWNQPFEISVNSPMLSDHAMLLSVFIENYSNEGGIDQPVKYNAIGKAEELKTWYLKGGPGDPFQKEGWLAFSPSGHADKEPCFYRSMFDLPASEGNTLIWRFTPKGLGHGSVWVNGHNIGRYPEKINIESLYIPECWLIKRKNQLVIYDEDGMNPSQVSIGTEKKANRIKKQILFN